jgi:outer membrane protein OmpA-like peptidoglycan-associated protein
MKIGRRDHESSDQFFTIGVTDLMTSIAIIFILLFIVTFQSAPVAPVSADPANPNTREVLMAHFERLGLPIEKDPDDPQLLILVMPDALLNFDFGRATLRPAALTYLQEVIPRYATAFCGPFRSLIESVTIEGHTDDIGEDRRNLRLSQERAFQVMVKAMDILQGRPEDDCFQQIATASGRGKQDLLYGIDQQLNRDKSRRVLFKIRLQAPAVPRERSLGASSVPAI